MSVDYAAGLSHCDDLGVCGLDEILDKPQVVEEKVKLLADWLRNYAGSCVVHVGAGLSTSAGIRDFRGKRGVWTEMQRAGDPENRPSTSSIKQESDDYKLTDDTQKFASMKPFDETQPTVSHMALKQLCEDGLVKHIVSQNVDGLFLKANLDRSFISELHGDFYLDECTRCRSRFIRGSASATMRLQRSLIRCPKGGVNEATQCKGYLRDTILDWESPIPYNELRVATRESKRNKLHICIGTSLQLSPSKDLVCKPNKLNKLVIINLQPTKFDKRADLVINYYADDVMLQLAKQLDFEIPNYAAEQNPTKNPDLIGTMWLKKSDSK